MYKTLLKVTEIDNRIEAATMWVLKEYTTSMSKAHGERFQVPKGLKWTSIGTKKVFFRSHHRRKLIYASVDSSMDIQSNGGSLPISDRKLRDYTEVAYMTGRAKVVNEYFPNAIGIDDFLHRLEIALYAYGFNGDNSIGMFHSIT